ncbi:MAG: hypothetical protein JEY79_13960 [Pseudodesulfovibrio sp.]|nr:hypothetical protein [Pseudodesulfovibrio sp.]
MSLTFEEHLERQDSQKIYLAEIELAYMDQGSVATEMIYLSDQSIDPHLTDIFYEPKLEGVPMFRRSMQEIVFGRSSSAFGNLTVINADGGLDDLLHTRQWEGRTITIKLGFDGLATNQFRPVFTGRMGRPSWDFQKVTIPIQDYQTDCLRKVHPEYDGADTLDNLLGAALGHAGISSIDLTMRSAWATENAFTAYLVTDGYESVATVLDRIISLVGGWWGFDRDGTFIIGTFKEPSGQADLTITDLDLLPSGFSEKIFDRHYWKVNVGYYSNAPETRATATQEDPIVQDFNPLAMEMGTRETILNTEADADTIKTRLFALYSAPRRVLTVKTKVRPLLLRLHSTVALELDRHGQHGLFRLIGFSEDYKNSEITMELWA